MDITTYKWPAVAAASLHGALLILFPSAPHLAGPTVHEITLAPFPSIDEPVVIDPANTPADPPDQKSSGGPKVADLPEDPAPPVIDNGLTQKLQPYERPVTGPIITTVVDFPGIGPGDGPGTSVNVGVPTIKDLDRIPRATVQPSPQYPESMKKDGMAGSVLVEFYVDASGRVYRADATRYSHASFVEPAVRAVLKWHFEPGRRNGRAVPFRMAVPMEFSAPAN